MIADCQWFTANLEAFFCETLEAEEFLRASEHLKTCLSCRNEVQAFHDVDPMIRQVLNYRMMKSRAGALTPRRRPGFQLGLAAGALALAAVLVFAVFVHESTSPKGIRIQPSTPTANLGSDSQQPGETKSDTIAPTIRTKPDGPDQDFRTGRVSPEPVIADNAPEFQVIDPAGYSKDLQDYRGRLLLFGVWSADQPEAAQNLQRLYQAFGTRHEVQILGVSSRNQNRMAGTTFPMVFNNGSRLLETQISSYVVVDKSGVVQMRGSLLGDSSVLIPRIKARLDELGGR